MFPEMVQVQKSEMVHETNLAQVDRHKTSDPVMVTVVRSISTGGNFFAENF